MTLPLKIKRVLLEPDPRLRLPNADVTETWDELEPWVKLMWKAMYRISNGVGLAAPQVGWNVRLFIMDPARFKGLQPVRLVYWNPRIVELRGEPKPMHEGCLSLPGVFGDVLRYPEVRIAADSPIGHRDDIVFGEDQGIGAQIVQHEMDHLKGELCFEKLTKKATA